MPVLMGIDIETYSSAPLPKCGVYRYCDAPDFEILLFSYAFDDEPVQTIDLASGETLPKEAISALEDPDIQLITVVPHEGQANNWTEAWRERYFRILEYSSDVVTLESHYSSGCYHARNRYLVDHADSVLALYNGSPTGGTAYTVKYACQRNKEIIVIDPATMERRLIPPRLRCE